VIVASAEGPDGTLVKVEPHRRRRGASTRSCRQKVSSTGVRIDASIGAAALYCGAMMERETFYARQDLNLRARPTGHSSSIFTSGERSGNDRAMDAARTFDGQIVLV
jgi:hypothetical protein